VHNYNRTGYISVYQIALQNVEKWKMYIIDDWIEDKPCTCNMPLFYAIQLRSTYSWIFRFNLFAKTRCL